MFALWAHKVLGKVEAREQEKLRTFSVRAVGIQKKGRSWSARTKKEERAGFALEAPKERGCFCSARTRETKKSWLFALWSHKIMCRVEAREQAKRRKGRRLRWGHTKKGMWLMRYNQRKEERVGVRAGGKQRKRRA